MIEENWIEELEAPQRYKELPAHQILLDCGLKAGEWIVDLGCGTGFFTIPASEIIQEEGKIYALDKSSKMLTYLRTKIEKPNIVPILLEGQKIPLKDQLLDCVLLAFVLSEVEDLGFLLREAKRVLKHRGRIVILEWKVNLVESSIELDEAKLDQKEPDRKELDRKELETYLKELSIPIKKSLDLNSKHYLLLGEVDHRDSSE